MVQSYQSPVRVYKWPFELVMAAYEGRFPTCPQIPIVVATEIVEEDRSPDGALHTVVRKCKLNVDAPYLLKKVAGVDFVYFTQKNCLDRRRRRLDIEATNVTFDARIGIKEFCCYYVHPDNVEWTCFEQSASLDVKSMFGFEATVEKIAVKQYAANIAKGKEILADAVEALIARGTTDFPVWQDSAESPSHPASASLSDSAIELLSHDDPSRPASRPPSPRPSPRDSPRPDRPVSSSSGEYQDAETGMEPGHWAQASHHLASSSHRHHSHSKAATAQALSQASQALSRTGTIIRRSSISQPSSSSQGGDGRLTEGYIQRCLGHLTTLEESRLCELKYSLEDWHKGKLPNDAHLLRFLRARDFDVVAARDMLSKSLLWRKSHAVDKILSTYERPAVVEQFFPGAWHGADRLGRPLFVLRFGALDIKGLMRSVGEEGLVKLVLSLCEDGLQRCAAQTKQLGKPISAWTLLVDLEGLSMRHLWRPGVKALLRIIEIMEANYPETMGLALIVRAPRVFPVLWTLVSPLIDENTKKKLMMHSSAEVATEALAQFLDPAIIPHFLGGPAFFLASEGGHVPKALQTFHPSDHPDHILDSHYQTGYLYKGLPHEVLVSVSSSGAVLTWDFDVVKGAGEFSILRCPDVRVETRQASPVLGALSPGALVAAHSEATPVAFDRSLKLGLDLFVEVKPIRVTERDSVQGSHFCSHPGTYVLQWRHLDAAAAAQGQSFDFSLPAKAKVVYYWELLNGGDFRGSCASLASSKASFSSLAHHRK